MTHVLSCLTFREPGWSVRSITFASLYSCYSYRDATVRLVLQTFTVGVIGLLTYLATKSRKLKFGWGLFCYYWSFHVPSGLSWRRSYDKGSSSLRCSIGTIMFLCTLLVICAMTLSSNAVFKTDSGFYWWNMLKSGWSRMKDSSKPSVVSFWVYESSSLPLPSNSSSIIPSLLIRPCFETAFIMTGWHEIWFMKVFWPASAKLPKVPNRCRRG